MLNYDGRGARCESPESADFVNRNGNLQEPMMIGSWNGLQRL